MDTDNDTLKKRFSPDEAVVDAPPALSLEVDNAKLLTFVKKYIKESRTFFKEEKKIDKRRATNERFYFGNQVDPSSRSYKGLVAERTLKTYEKPYSDNVIKEGEDILRPLILSRLPELIIKPGVEGDENSRSSAEAITKVVNNALTSREMKKVLTRAFRHHPVYFTGVIKYRWNPQKGRMGDIDFEVIHPKNILVDHTATENNEAYMKIIVHFVEKSLKEWIMLFPNKKEVLIDYARQKGKINNLNEEALAVNLKIPEVWFDWLESAIDEKSEEDPQFEVYSGVMWYADRGQGSADDVLDKRKNPNWDWEGEEKLFFNNRPVPDELLPQIAMMGFEIPGIERQTIYRNFFGRPRKPFIFLGYEQWGQQPYDETTRIEENLLLQENYDTRGMQITKMIDDARGKHAFSSMSGLKRESVEEMDLDNPDEDLFIDGDLRQVHSFISKEQPSSQMFEDLSRTRERIMAKIHVSAPTRGEIVTSTATTNQIARESDFTVADDIADDMVNEVATQMGEALLHMMKLRYTPEHFTAVLGSAGDTQHQNFTEDVIEDGMEVEISASGTDKLRAERQAKEEAQLGLIDPITYYQDTGRHDPEGRFEKLFLFQSNPELYFKKFVEGQDVPDIAESVMFGAQQRMQEAGVPPQGQGGMQQPRMQPSPQDTTAIPQSPQGSPRGLFGQAAQGLSRMFGGGG